ncbi:MAG: DUF6198 family protein [Clostridia bacterium]|nr:DUF6198 family protein [Clostridia bacterium]
MSSKNANLKEKKIVYSEYAYFFSVLFLAISIAFMKAAGFGVSLSSAPAYVIYEKVSLTQQISYGTAEYTIQAFILLFLFIVTGKFGKKHVFSFLTTLIFASTIDAITNVLELLPLEIVWVRVLLLALAIVIGPLGYALMDHTYISPIVYILYEQEIAKASGRDRNLVYWTFNVISGIFAIGLSFYFFGVGAFVGVNIATILYTLSKILLREPWEKFIEKHFKFRTKYWQLERHFK